MLGTMLHHRFRLEQALHRGASGTLYLATDDRTGEMLAVKVFPPHTDFAAEDGLRYARAMARAARLNHPHLLSPRHTGVAEGVCFQVLPFAPGEDLAALLADGPVPPAQLLHLLLQLAEGLEALHAAGLYHLNIKPGNVRVSREGESWQVVLCDPLRGLLATPHPDDPDAATACCLAPEQTPWLEFTPDGRADFYALGALGFLLATGEPPFTAPSAAEIWHRHVVDDAPSPARVRPELPDRLCDLLRRLLAPRPRDRFQTLAALRAELHAVLAGIPTGEPGGGTVPEPEADAAGGPERPPDPPEAAAPEWAPEHDPASPVAGGQSLGGRQAAQESLLAALARAGAGPGGGVPKGALLWLSGEPGSGRTALVSELLPHLEAARALVLRAAAVPGAECTPFRLPAALLDALVRRTQWLPAARRKALAARLEAALGPQAGLATALAPSLRTLLPEVATPEALPLGRERTRVLHALCQPFIAAAEPGRPVVLWLEHVEWADADSLDWLARLAQRLATAPLLVVAAVPPDAGSHRPELTPLLDSASPPPVTLAPLQASHVSAWLSATLAPGPGAPGDLPGRLAQWLVSRWGGLPLHHELALQVLLARGVLRRDTRAEGAGDARGDWCVDWEALERGSWPESLPALVQHRLELLPDEAQPVLQAVAAAPDGLSFPALCALLEHVPPPVLMDGLERAVRAGVLERREGRTAFRHAVLREAVWRALPAETRANLQLTLAAELEAQATVRDEPGDLERLHALMTLFRAGGDTVRTVTHGLRYAGQAWSQGALRAVCRSVEALRPELAGDPRQGRLLLLGGMAHTHLGQAERALELLDAALALGLSETAELDAQAHAAWAEHLRGDDAAALQRAEKALERAGETLPGEGMGTALARLGSAALRRYESLRATAAGAPLQPLDPREERVVTLLALASRVLARQAPHRAMLADERILRIAGVRTPSPALLAALVRLGSMEGDPDGPYFAQARTVLERHGFPHAEADFHAALGRCRLAAGQWLEARESLRVARTAYRELGAVADEAEVLAWLVELVRLEGSAQRLTRGVVLLADVAAQSQEPGTLHMAEALRAYAAAYAAEQPFGRALETMQSARQALLAAGEHARANYVLALAAELALAVGNLGVYLALLHGDAWDDGASAEYGGGLLLAARAEGHLVQAALLPEEADHHLQLARTLLRDLRAAHGWPLRADLARVEVLERFHTTADAEALKLAAEALEELDENGVGLPALWLRYRVAEALKTAGDTQWMAWAGEALTACDALPAPLYLAATRHLLELEVGPGAPPAPVWDGASADGAARSGVPGANAGGLSALLHQLAVGGAMDEAHLLDTLLDMLVRAADAETGVWVQAGLQGEPVLLAARPTGEGARALARTWLAEAVWNEGEPQVLRHYRPPAPDESASSAALPEALSLLGLPWPDKEHGPTRAALLLAVPARRTVFEPAQVEILGPLWAQATALLALNRRLRTEHDRADDLDSASEQERLRARWAEELLRLDDPQALLDAYLREAVPGGPAPEAVLCLRAGEGLRLAALRVTGKAGPELTERFPLPLAPGRAEAALHRRAPVLGAALDAPPATVEERTLLHRLGVRPDAWLPLVYAGETFGVLLLAGPGVPADPRVLERNYMAPLLAATPAFHAAWRTAAAGAALSREREQARRAEHQAALARRLLPVDWPTAPEALEVAFQDGLERTIPMLAGEVRGLILPEVGPAESWRDALRAYYGQVRHGLSLHEGALLRVQHPQWIAGYPGTVDNALWGAQTLHQLLLDLEADPPLDGGIPPVTGMGLHYGRLRWEPLPQGDHATPTLAGAGVRTAWRLAGMSRSFRCGILVSRETVDALETPRRFDLRPLGRLRPTGGNTRLEVFELYSVREAEVRGSMRTLHDLWEEALREFRMGRWRQAAAGFARYAQELPQDRPARYFLRQSRQRAQG